jgi:hypothetical protein
MLIEAKQARVKREALRCAFICIMFEMDLKCRMLYSVQLLKSGGVL